MTKVKVGYVGFAGHRHHKVHILVKIGPRTPYCEEDHKHPEEEREYATTLCGKDSRKNGCKALVWNEDPKGDDISFCKKCAKLLEKKEEKVST